jgi:acyl dehydratase
MPLDAQRLLSREFPGRLFTYDNRQSILYALAAGMGQDPLDRRELDFVIEPRLVLPSQVTAIAWDYRFIDNSGINETLILHGAQSIRMHSALPAAGSVISHFRVTDIHDKGPGKGAVIVAEILLSEEGTGRAISTSRWTSYARGEGGFGGERGPAEVKWIRPGRAPEHVVATPTSTVQSLMYRLLGDTNPLHCDPRVAAEAGYERPIMHGLCTYGIVCRSLVVTVCGHDPDALGEMNLTFRAPAYPGDTVVTQVWRNPRGIALRAFARERDVELATGTALLSPGF